MEPEFVVLVLWNSALSAHIVASWYLKKRKAKKFKGLWMDDEVRHIPSRIKWKPGGPAPERIQFDKHIDHKF